MRKLLLFICLLLSGCAGSDSETSSETSSNSSPTATVVADGVIQLNWDASSGFPDGYYVEQSNDGIHFTQIQDVTVTNAVIVNAVRNRAYQFRVRAYNSGGLSPYSAVVDVIP